MADIQYDPRVPDNVVRLSVKEPEAILAAYECGKLVVLEDIRIDADYALLSSVPVPENARVRRDKFCLARHMPETGWQTREAIWRHFETGPFENDPEGYARFRQEVQSVNGQMNALIDQIFASLRFRTRSITWKFQQVTGENLHIDNLQGCEKSAQIRLFANLHTRPRVWGVARHWRHYASALFHPACLDEALHDPYDFNTRLSTAAFGSSHQTTDDPRHTISFEPGEIWLANSAVVAHQVKSGGLLTIAHYEYPYTRYRQKREALPAMIQELGVEKLGFFGYHRKVSRLKANQRRARTN